MRCTCHPQVLSAAREQALALLTTWVAVHGGHNLASRLTRGDAEAQRVYNQCSYNFGIKWPVAERPADLQKLSALAVACHLAGLEYEPGMLRSTSYEDDLNELLRLYDAGQVLSEASLKESGHSKLFSRSKNRSSNNTWLKVFQDLQQRRPGLEFGRFFTHSPTGVFEKDGEISVFRGEDKPHIIAYAEKVFAAYASTSTDKRLFVFLDKAPREVRNIYTRLANICLRDKDPDFEPRRVFERASGQVFKRLSHHGGYVPGHTAPDGTEHRPVRSFSEMLVDNVLHTAIPDYPRRHRHDVMLKELIPTLTLEDSPYTSPSARSPVVDILIDGKLVIEVSFMTERLNPDYTPRMKWKLETLRAAGFQAINVKIESGATVNARIVREALRGIGVECDAEKLKEAFWENEPVRERTHTPLKTPEDVVKAQQAKQQAKALTSPKQTNAEKARALAKDGWSETDIANHLGMTLQNVQKALARPVGSRVDWDAETDLGKVPDAVLATRHGVDPSTVVNARKRRSIPAFRDLRATASVNSPK